MCVFMFKDITAGIMSNNNAGWRFALIELSFLHGVFWVRMDFRFDLCALYY